LSLFAFPAGFRALVVGGAGDIGSAIAGALLAEGCEVVATGVDAAAVAACRLPPHARLKVRPLDVTDDAAIAAFAGGLGRLDVFQKVLDVNLTGTFRLCNACKPLLAANGRRGGAIVNIASMNATAALPWIPAYCASKGGVVMLTKSLAMAWAADGIRVNALAPGYVETAINAEGRKDEAFHARIASRIPLGRWAQPTDIAPGALFLCSPAARYVNGTVLAVDGGFLAG
jgi:NAD(P)-dependent dehydrogenase (short-subunit alcohol dehydrogenase family)